GGGLRLADVACRRSTARSERWRARGKQQIFGCRRNRILAILRGGPVMTKPAVVALAAFTIAVPTLRTAAHAAHPDAAQPETCNGDAYYYGSEPGDFAKALACYRAGGDWLM